MNVPKSLLLATLLVILVLITKCSDDKPFRITPIEDDGIVYANEDDTASSKATRIDHFIIEGSLSGAHLRQRLEEYAKTYADTLKARYKSYEMIFFKESSALNVQKMQSTEVAYRWKAFAHAKPSYSILWHYGKRLE